MGNTTVQKPFTICVWTGAFPQDFQSVIIEIQRGAHDDTMMSQTAI
jgi:hypothetical protein